MKPSKTPIPLEKICAPAHRALLGSGYTTLEQLSKIPESQIASLHGIGPNALKTLRLALEAHNLSFNNFAKQGTVCFITSENKVLLALIEYGSAGQKWNGIGGVVDKNETPVQAVVREISEETEIEIDEKHLTSHGAVDIDDLQLHVFTATKWTGRLKIKDPALKELKWFQFDEVPYAHMWGGNDKWLPRILNNQSD